MRKKIIILFSLVALVIALLVCFAAVASNPPPLRVGTVLDHPFSYFTAQVKARPNNAFIDSYCGVSSDGHTCTFGTHLNFPMNHYCMAARRFTYRLDSNGTVMSISSRWTCYIFDFLD